MRGAHTGRRRQKAKAAEGGSPQEKKRKHAAACATTLLEKNEASDPTPKKRCRNNSTDKKVSLVVNQRIRGTFKGWTGGQTHLTVRNGCSLHQRLTQDKEEQLAGDTTIKMGKCYYQETVAVSPPMSLGPSVWRRIRRCRLKPSAMLSCWMEARAMLRRCGGRSFCAVSFDRAAGYLDSP